MFVRIGTLCPRFSTYVSCVVSTNQQWCFIPHQKQHVSFGFHSVVSKFSNVFNNNVFFYCFHVAGLSVRCIYSSCCCFGLWVVFVFVSLSLSWFNCHPLHITQFPDGLLVKTSPITHYTFSRFSLTQNCHPLHILHFSGLSNLFKIVLLLPSELVEKNASGQFRVFRTSISE